MKILHVLPSLGPGGMERMVISLAADAVAHGDSVLVASGPGIWTGLRRAGAAHVALPVTTRGARWGWRQRGPPGPVYQADTAGCRACP